MVHLALLKSNSMKTEMFSSLGGVLNRPEFRFGEVLLPWTVIIGVLGFLAAWITIAIIEYTGLARYVWHLPLLFVALIVLFSSLIGIAISP
jgi:Protein of unknown function (DUF1656)